MLNVYIDESGDLGLNDGYFIIAMLIAHDSKRIKNIVKYFCAKNHKEELHAFELNFVQKQGLINKLTKQADFSVSYICADRIMITNKVLFKNNNLLFNYLFSFLVKDVIKANTDDVNIYLDNRTQKVASINSLSDYIKIKAITEWGYTKKLTIRYMDSKNCKTVQMADLIASTVRRKYVHHQNDFYDKLNIVKSISFQTIPLGKNLTNFVNLV